MYCGNYNNTSYTYAVDYANQEYRAFFELDLIQQWFNLQDSAGIRFNFFQSIYQKGLLVAEYLSPFIHGL